MAQKSYIPHGCHKVHDAEESPKKAVSLTYQIANVNKPKTVESALRFATNWK